MSAQVTEAHRELARRIMFEFTQAGTATASDVRMAAQIIADSKAKAVAEWQDFVHLRGEAIDSLLLECDRLRAECNNLRADLDAIKAIRNEETARAERAEAELANIRALADRRNKRDHSQDTTHQLVAALDQALDIAQAELATERARIADLVADLNDVCITLTSAEEDCDDYAMRNTRFKLTAVREVLLQHIPNAAMKEETK